MTPQFLFRLRDVWMMVPADSIETIVEDQAPTRLPLAPGHIVGLLPFGERALPIVDLGTFLGLEADSPDSSALQRILVVTAEGMRIGIRVNRTAGVLHIQEGQATPLDALLNTPLARWSLAEVDTDWGRAVALDMPALMEAARA